MREKRLSEMGYEYMVFKRKLTDDVSSMGMMEVTKLRMGVSLIQVVT